MPTSRANLKSYFNAGDKPTERQFHEWIDAFYHKDEDQIVDRYLNIPFLPEKVAEGSYVFTGDVPEHPFSSHINNYFLGYMKLQIPSTARTIESINFIGFISGFCEVTVSIIKNSQETSTSEIAAEWDIPSEQQGSDFNTYRRSSNIININAAVENLILKLEFDNDSSSEAGEIFINGINLILS